MPRPTIKDDLMIAANEKYKKLNSLIDKISYEELNTPFDFSSDEKKKETHWKRDKKLRDILIHLYEWHQLFLNWVETNSKDIYKWVGGSALGSYFVSTTSSHYDWAMNKLRAHQKNCTKKQSDMEMIECILQR